MSWQVGQRIVAEAAEATVRGSSFAGGAQVHIDVAFRLVEWPWETNGPISLVPQPSEIKARVTRGELNLGFAIPNPAQVIVPPRHSASSIVRFTLLLSTAGLVALETARDGGSIDLVMSLVAHPFGLTVNSGDAPGIYIVPVGQQFPFQFQVPKEQWLVVLKSVGYCDSILTELRFPSGTGDPGGHLARGVAARTEGRYSDAIAACRIAVERLDGAPKEGSGELERIVKAKRIDLSERERFVMLRSATHIFASPAHHGATHHEREDADLAIAMTAALLRLAPRWRTEDTERDTEDSSS
jgi:hypothetical protein